MTNLSASVERRPVPLKADVVIKPRQLLMLELATGLGVLYTTAPGHVFLGWATHSRDSNGLSDGALTALYSNGMVELAPDAGVTPQHGGAVYGVDPDTFNVTPGTGLFIGRVVQRRDDHDGTEKWTVDTFPAFNMVPEATV